jgi:hypothetical protein
MGNYIPVFVIFVAFCVFCFLGDCAGYGMEDRLGIHTEDRKDHKEFYLFSLLKLCFLC